MRSDGIRYSWPYHPELVLAPAVATVRTPPGTSTGSATPAMTSRYSVRGLCSNPTTTSAGPAEYPEYIARELWLA